MLRVKRSSIPLMMNIGLVVVTMTRSRDANIHDRLNVHRYGGSISRNMSHFDSTIDCACIPSRNCDKYAPIAASMYSLRGSTIVRARVSGDATAAAQHRDVTTRATDTLFAKHAAFKMYSCRCDHDISRAIARTCGLVARYVKTRACYVSLHS